MAEQVIEFHVDDGAVPQEATQRETAFEVLADSHRVAVDTLGRTTMQGTVDFDD